MEFTSSLDIAGGNAEKVNSTVVETITHTVGHMCGPLAEVEIDYNKGIVYSDVACV